MCTICIHKLCKNNKHIKYLYSRTGQFLNIVEEYRNAIHFIRNVFTKNVLGH